MTKNKSKYLRKIRGAVIYLDCGHTLFMCNGTLKLPGEMNCVFCDKTKLKAIVKHAKGLSLITKRIANNL